MTEAPICPECGASVIVALTEQYILAPMYMYLTGVCSECQTPICLVYSYDEEEAVAREERQNGKQTN